MYPPNHEMNDQGNDNRIEEPHQLELWECQFCKVYNQFCVKYACQMAILSGVIITSLIKLSDETTENREFWSSLLSFSLGVVCPQPQPKI